jgi:endonuclease/exonuclease/phosphatase family metal-dependent hydrolase
MMPTLATFNANNLFLRYRFSDRYPGDMSGKSRIEAAEVAAIGFVPGKMPGSKGFYDPARFIIWDAKRRALSARALSEPDGALPDILCWQEVENIDALRVMNERYFGGHYPYILLIDGYDVRNIDVGITSRFPLDVVRTHVDELDAGGKRLFSRDCLEVTVALGGETLTLFLNHFKSKLVTREKNESAAKYQARIRESHARRQRQAERVAELVEARFASAPATALYAVVGDFNDTPESPYLRSLVTSQRLVDVLAAYGGESIWTYYWRAKGRVSRIDYLLASPALAARVAAKAAAGRKPHIERRGVGYRDRGAGGNVLPVEATWTHFEADEVTPRPPDATPDAKVPFGALPRYPEVLADPNANISDHCPVKIWF